MKRSEAPLWQCPKCERHFANRNQAHSCGRYTLEHHFIGKEPGVRKLFDKVRSVIESVGPVRVLAEKSRIAFQVRMSFAQVTVRKRWLDGHVVLARRRNDRRFRSVQTISPRNHVHVFRIDTEADIDGRFREWIAEAYLVGEQKHLDL